VALEKLFDTTFNHAQYREKNRQKTFYSHISILKADVLKNIFRQKARA